MSSPLLSKTGFYSGEHSPAALRPVNWPFAVTVVAPGRQPADFKALRV
jgi:hypothetical protein